jgi:hypothetical protein
MIVEHEHQAAGETSADSTVKRQLRKAAEEAKETTKQTARDLKDRYARTVAECKDGVAQRVSHLGEALQDAAARLRNDGDVNLADGVDAAARKVSDLSSYLHNADLAALRRETENFTRKHPESVYGGLFLAGLAIARLLKASTGSSRYDPSSQYHESRQYELEEETAEFATTAPVETTGYTSPATGYSNPSGAPQTPSSGTYGTSSGAYGTSGTLGSTAPSGITPQP